MSYIVKPFAKKKVKAELTLPGSKSITNRCLVISALARGKTELSNVLFSDDTFYMMKVLKDLGLKIDVDEDKRRVVIEGGMLPHGEHSFFVGNAGTTMRFLSSYLSLGGGSFLLDGDERMRERPIQDLLDVLNKLGVNIFSVKGNGCPPVRINSKGIKGGRAKLSGKNSSQYLSSVLMSAPYAVGDVILCVDGEITSRPYAEMTLNIMKEFGVSVKNSGFKEFAVTPSEYISLSSYYIEPDASTASYFLAATAILSGEIKIRGLGKNSIQGDTNFIKILEMMGCEIDVGEDFIKLVSDGNLDGIEIDMNDVPDLVPTLAIIALFARTPTKIFNVANLRIKESDRLKALSNEIKKIGGKVNEFDDGLEIYPEICYNSSLISTYNDHRIAMAFSIAGLKIGGIEIDNPGCVSKSFPEFFNFLERFFN
ncbi:MAG: 3-phosphoshikimate 1-carboxyvinyltransferase [Brevinematia bacterium]